VKVVAFLIASVLALSLTRGTLAQAPTPAPAPASVPTTSAQTSPQSAPAQKKSGWKEGDACVQDNKKDINDEIHSRVHPVGPELVPAGYFLPAGGPVELGLSEGFNGSVRYFGYIERQDSKVQTLLPRGAVTAARVPDDHSLVKKGLLDKGDTLLTVQVPDSIAGLWIPATVYTWACDSVGDNRGRPKSISELTMPVSSPLYSGIAVWASIVILYVAAALAARKIRQGPAGIIRYLDPVYLTAGTDGKGSLSKLQILFFSMIIAGLLGYIVLRTGVLSDLSQTILLLLGIAAVGSTAAKGTDTRVNRLDSDNGAWLIQRKWLPTSLSKTNQASWSDIISSDGEFDVYRYQSCVFSLIVGVALLAGGITELASFEIPTTLLGILGLSQVVYVGGKLVMPTSLSELNSAVTELRALEKNYVDAALAHPDPNPAAGGDAAAVTRRRAGEVNYKNYVDKAQRVAILFKSATGVEPATEALQPPIVG